MNYDFVSSLNSDKYFCTIELVNGIGASEHSVKRAAAALGITPIDAGRKGFLYTYGDYIRIKSWIEVNVKRGSPKKEEEKKAPVKVPLELLQKAHPLVTDVRCFNINWWPDTVPKVYEEIWNED